MIYTVQLEATPSAKPFVKWVGSKRRLLPFITPHVPAKFEKYFEPFLGSGSLYFELAPDRAYLNDACGELIDAYEAVRDNVSAVIRYLRPLKIDKELFYSIRENRSTGRFKRTAEFLYLNKSCWNGLYRVNSKGKFNVPFGAPRSPNVFSAMSLKAAANQLNSGTVKLSSVDFEAACEFVNSGDFVFFDPPYVTKHNMNGFSEWNEKIFSWNDQLRLKSLVDRLTEDGAKVLMTNANHESISELYDDYNQYIFNRSSTLASNKAFRASVDELIIRNY